MRTPTKCAMSTQRRRWRIFLFCDWCLVISLSFKTSACVFILQKHQWFCAQSPSESSWARVHNLILLLYWFYLLTGAFQSALSVDCNQYAEINAIPSQIAMYNELWHIQYCISVHRLHLHANGETWGGGSELNAMSTECVFSPRKKKICLAICLKIASLGLYFHLEWECSCYR